MEKTDRHQEILEYLEKMHPGKLLLSPAEVAPLLGLKPGTVYNRLSNGSCPVKSRRSAGRPRFLIHDIAQYLSGD